MHGHHDPVHAQKFAPMHSGAGTLRGASPQQRKQLCASQRAQLRSQGSLLPPPADGIPHATPVLRHMPPLPPALGEQWLAQHAAADDAHARNGRLSRALAERLGPEPPVAHARLRSPSVNRAQRSAQRRSEGM